MLNKLQYIRVDPIAMMGLPSVLAVLASLLILHPPSGSAEVLDPSCGITRSGLSPQTVGPWTALLHVNGRIVCAGTLIHSRFILTAAHCIRNGETLQVRLGEYGRVGAEQPENLKVDMAVRHRFYNNRTHENDIGLLRLSWAVQYKGYISPICIVVDPQKQIPFDAYTGTSWKSVNKKNIIFHATRIQPVAPTECRQILNFGQESTRFCTRNLDRGSCEGPSGSALSQVHNNRSFQFGVASYNELDCQPTRVYTDVRSFSSWIHKILQLYGGPNEEPRLRPATTPNVSPTTPLPTTTPPPTTTTLTYMGNTTPSYVQSNLQFATTKSNFPQWDAYQNAG